MNKAAGAWIREQREKQKLTREALAQRSGLSVATLARLESPTDKRNVGVNRSTIFGIAKALRLNGSVADGLTDWAQGVISKREFFDVLNRLVPRFAGDVGETPARERARRPGLPPADFFATIGADAVPIVGEVTAGGLVESMVYEPGEEWERVPLRYPDRERVYALRIKGDSMAPEYRSGEILILQDVPIEELRDGDDAVVQTGSESTFKRVIVVGSGRLRLMPLNPVFETKECRLDQVTRVGRVLGVFRSNSRFFF